MVQRFAVVAGVSVLTVLAVTPGRVVPTLLTNTSADSARVQKHLHAEAALVRVAVTVTGWTKEIKRKCQVMFHRFSLSVSTASL